MAQQTQPERSYRDSNLSADHSEAIDSALIRSHVAKILESPAFSGSERMSRFLQFTVDRVLAGRGKELKEYLLGTEIFDRSESFDPRIDPIVRVEARRLRSKLKAYYEGEGVADAIVIEFPKGAYVPRFLRHDGAPAAAPAPPVTASPAKPAEAAAPSRDILVLPFTNLSPDPDTEYFSDGLTEELIHGLTKVDGLRVVAWNTAVKLKDRQDDIPSIGRQLNVGVVLVGSVRGSADRLRIMARLIDTESGYYLWSETYDREMKDLFAIQEEISQAIIETLRIRLIGAKASHTIARSPSNLEAYNLYLRGRFHWNKRTRDGIERAARYFQEAVAIQPDFATGYAGLADAYTILVGQGLEQPREVICAAKKAASRALELDPDLAEAHASLALIVSMHEWKWVEAEAHYRRAIELSPSYISARHWYACDFLALLGRFEEAIAEAEVALHIDPLSCLIQETMAYVLMLARRYDEALEQYRRTAELDPYFYRAYTGAGRTYIHMGRYQEAVAMIERGIKLADDSPLPLGALGQAHALAGDRTAARALLAQLAGMAKTKYVPSTPFAMIHIGLGEKEKALEWLERACDRHEPSVSNLNIHAAYDCLRSEPRFVALLRRIGLVE